MWDFRADRPIYLQLIEQLQLMIVGGTYRPGDKLPSVRDLAQEAAVNPNTMQKALTELERSGILYSQRTNGRFITEDKAMIEQIRNQLAGEQVSVFLQKMKEFGYESKDIISLIEERMNQETASEKKGE